MGSNDDPRGTVCIEERTDNPICEIECKAILRRSVTGGMVLECIKEAGNL